MTQAKLTFSSFEEYLAYDDGTDQLYEFVDGELVELPPESGRNSQILMFIILAIASLISLLPPLLVIEIVSPGETNRSRDYIDKRNQYQDRGIPEYWIVDPQIQTVTVLKLNEAGIYIEIGVFQGGDRIESLLFLTLDLTPEQLFAP
ncbi:MAG: hypothetical protein C4288_00435 [Leptolyngbya sp. ERB_1_1]